MSKPDFTPLILDGNSLTLERLCLAARHPDIEIRLDEVSVERVRAGWREIERLVERYERARSAGDAHPPHVYGVTTGFGEFKDAPIEPDDLLELQRNILKSHAVGVGDTSRADDPSNYFPAAVIRAVMILRLNTFLKGYSGVRPVLLEFIRGMLNAGVVPLVPTRGSVGSSGDLCPLAHLFGVLLGQGRYRVVKSADDAEGMPHPWHSAAELPRLVPFPPGPVMYKEGLALSNGATFCAAELALSVSAAVSLACVADIAAAMTMEGLCGRTKAFDEKVHHVRGHSGQIESAANIRSLIEGSRQIDRAASVQDPYSLRCAPQVHGASRDAIVYARTVVEHEINGATDNPLFFPTTDPSTGGDGGSSNDAAYVEAYSAGNFHGQPLALAADFLAIAVAELASISERRTQMLLDRHHNRNLPANLTPHGGLHSGLMIAQYCAAGLVSENKVLCHPASVDSIPTSSNAEDHNSMASVATRKLRTVVGNAQAVLAIELMVSAQAIEWRVGMGRDPNSSSHRTAGVTGDDARCSANAGDAVPGFSSSGSVRVARSASESEKFRRATSRRNRPTIASLLGLGTRTAYLAVREIIEPVVEDRALDDDIRRLRRCVEQNSIPEIVDASLKKQLHSIAALRMS